MAGPSTGLVPVENDPKPTFDLGYFGKTSAKKLCIAIHDLLSAISL